MVEIEVARGEHTAAMDRAEEFGVSSFELDRDYAPVSSSPSADVAADVEEAGQEVVVVRGTIDKDDIEELEAQENVLKVWTDARIEPFAIETPRPMESELNYADFDLEFLDRVPVEPDRTREMSIESAAGDCPIPQCDCDPGTAKGAMADVARFHGVDRIWNDGRRGRGITVGVVDGGISAQGRVNGGRIPRVVGGWPEADWGTTAKWGEHGNMCATDVLGMAPEAEILDLRISDRSDIPGTLSDALAAFDWALNRHRRTGTPHVLTNSWGIFQESWGSDYARDINHVFTRKVSQVINEGIVTLFAAGNCGGRCPDGRCNSDAGPGKSIWGANSHPQVLTVGAVNTNGQYIGYSSQGPGALDHFKPDVMGASHFTGYFQSDSGTSAATPIVAGISALLKQADPSLSPGELKGTLKGTAEDMGPSGWDQHSGSGIVQAKDAVDRILQGQAADKVYPWETRLTGTQFRGDIEKGQTQRWFTFGWPTEYNVHWSVRPTSPGGRIDWDVHVERGSDGRLTYWLTITNVGPERTGFKAKYTIVR